MLNLRNVTLAAALLLALAVGAYADPYSDVYEASAEVVAEVSNIKILEPATKRVAWTDPIEHENLVEGHSVFVTMEINATRVPVEGNADVIGHVECDVSKGTKTSMYVVTIPMPAGQPPKTVEVPVVTEVNYVKARCSLYGGLIVTPTIYCQVTGDWDCDPPAMQSAPVMAPTGRVIPYVTPDGQHAEAEELTFIATPPGEESPRSFYAYRVPILLPWGDAEDFQIRNLQAPIPYDRLFEMDVWDFKFLYEDAVKRV